MPIVSKEQWTGGPMPGSQIIFGYRPPKNWQENLTKQEDQGYQRLLKQWLDEEDPAIKKQKWQAVREYWAERRKELGFGEPEK